MSRPINLICLLSCLKWSLAARILCIYPVPFESHQSVFKVVTEELSKQGHELVVLAPISQKNPLPNVTLIDVRELSYRMWDEGIKEHHTTDVSATDPVIFWTMIYKFVYPTVEAQFSVPEMQKLLNNEKEHFDLLIVEAVFPLPLMIGARFDVPIVLLSSFFGSADNFYNIGADINPVFAPDYNAHKIINLSFWDKLKLIYKSARLRLLGWKMEKVENEIIKKHMGDKALTMQEIKKKVQLLLLNVHPVWDNNRLVPPSVMYLGALHLKEPKPLPNDLQKYLDRSRNGVVYMSLGSKLKSSDLPPNTIKTVLKVFSTLPYDVIWKWDGGQIANKSENVRLEEWLPQNDLLHHPKIKAFVTHCGLQSTDEAIAAHVPLVGLPVFADQHTNAQKYQQHGIGVELDINHLDENEFRIAINTVIDDKSYRKNIKRLSDIMREQRKGAFDRAMNWVNYIIKYGEVNLKSPYSEMTFTEYYMLDIFIPLAVVSLVLLAMLLLIVKQVVIKMHTTSKLKKN